MPPDINTIDAEIAQLKAELATATPAPTPIMNEEPVSFEPESIRSSSSSSIPSGWDMGSSTESLDYGKGFSQMADYFTGGTANPTTPQEEQVNKLDIPTRLLAQAISGASGGAEGYLGGYGNELLDLVGGDSFKYAREKSSESYPKTNAIVDLYGSIVSPLNKLSQATQVAKKASATAKLVNGLSNISRSTGMAAIEGAGRNEEDRGAGATLGAGLNLAINGLLGVGGKAFNYLSDLGAGTQKGSIISETAQKSSARKTPMSQVDAFDVLQPEGVFKGSMRGDAFKGRIDDLEAVQKKEYSKVMKEVQKALAKDEPDAVLRKTFDADIIDDVQFKQMQKEIGSKSPKFLSATALATKSGVPAKTGGDLSTEFISKASTGSTKGATKKAAQDIEDADFFNISEPANKYRNLLEKNLNFSRTKSLLRDIQKPEDKEKVRKLILKQVNDYIGDNGHLVKGDFERLFDTQSYLKRGKYDKSITGQWKKSVDKAIAEDFRDSMKGIAKNVLGKDPYSKLNKGFQATKTIQPIAKDMAEAMRVKGIKDLAFAPFDSKIANFITNAGVLGTAAINPALPFALYPAGKYLGSPTGQMQIGRALESVGGFGTNAIRRTPKEDLVSVLLSVIDTKGGL